MAECYNPVTMVAIWGRLGIQKKIFAALALILLLMAGMLALQFVSRAIERNLSDRLINQLLPARAQVRDAKRLVIAADDEGAWYLLAASPSVRTKLLDSYRSNIGQIASWLRAADRAASSPEERIALAQFHRWWPLYREGNEQAFRLSRARRSAQARSVYVAFAYTPLTRALTLYESVLDHNIDTTQRRRAGVDLAAAIAAGTLSAGALGIAIAVAFRLGGSLRGRLGRVSHAIADVVRTDLVELDQTFRNIAGGDFEAPRYVYGREPIQDGSADELGSLAHSYNELLASLRAMSQRIDQAVFEARRRRQAEERLAYLQRYDDVTGLANRQLLGVELERAIRTRQSGGERVAVAYFGLMGFKMIEDSFGHGYAQHVLTLIARRLRESLRDGDMAARGGSDEFIAVFDPVTSREAALDLTHRLITALSKPFVLDGRPLFVNIRAGVSVSADDGDDADELLRNANTALSYARDTGGSDVVPYAAGLRRRSLQRLTLESDLQRALARFEFELHYQPIVSARHRRIEAFEALIRWRHPRLGLLEPASFMDVAEETAIEQIGDWVLHSACADGQRWRSAGHDVSVSVNVSMRQFRGGLFETVQHALRQTSFPATALELELTESVLLTDRQRAFEESRNLHRLGVRLAIDDFGTGYSSLAYLRTFPLDALKIDRSFVSDIASASYDRVLANTIILLGHSLGVRVIAEGVEDAGQAAILRELGCDAMQGYFFGKPASAAQSQELLESAAAVRG